MGLLPAAGRARGPFPSDPAARMRRIAASFRSLAIRMGGVLIKVGQFLSSRLDVLPREITAELAGLQDEVGAESFEAIRGGGGGRVRHAARARSSSTSSALPLPPRPSGRSIARGCARRSRAAAAPPPGRRQGPAAAHPGDRGGRPCRHPRGRRWLQRLKIRQPPRRTSRPSIEEFSRSLYEEIDYLNEGKNAEKFAAQLRASAPRWWCPPWSGPIRRGAC